MKLKDVVYVFQNKDNRQFNIHPRKKDLKKAGLKLKDILEIDLKCLKK